MEHHKCIGKFLFLHRLDDLEHWAHQFSNPHLQCDGKLHEQESEWSLPLVWHIGDDTFCSRTRRYLRIYVLSMGTISIVVSEKLCGITYCVQVKSIFGSIESVYVSRYSGLSYLRNVCLACSRWKLGGMWPRFLSQLTAKSLHVKIYFIFRRSIPGVIMYLCNEHDKTILVCKRFFEWEWSLHISERLFQAGNKWTRKRVQSLNKV